MNESHDRDDAPQAWADRAIDSALYELHGSKPPDLSTRVLQALRESPRGPLPALLPSGRREARAGQRTLAASVALLFVLATTWWAVSAWSGHEDLRNADRLSAVLELGVVRGDFECIEVVEVLGVPSPRSEVVLAGSTGSFTARAGHRLRSAGSSLARLGPFGAIEVSPGTELEVRSMELSLKQGVVVASALTLSVVVGVVTWHSLTRGETVQAGESVRMEAGPESNASLVAENSALRQRLDELERERTEISAEAQRTKATPEPVALKADMPVDAAPTPAQGALFSDERYPGLDSIDWSTVGTVTSEMGPMLVQLMVEMEKTGEMSTELAVKIQALNSKLVEQVPAMLKAGMPGFGPNGAYTHPLVVANVLGATLQASGQPLNDSQRAAIAGLARAFGVENQGIADQSREFELEHLMAESEMKDRFYQEVSTLLTPEQFAQVYPNGATGYDGVSLFSSSLMTRPYSEPVPASNAGDFARIASNKIGEQLGLDESTSRQVRSVVERMASAAPELWRDKGTAVETKLRMLKSGRTPAAMRQQLAIMREIQRQVPLTAEQKRQLSSMKHVLVPLPR